MSNSPCTDEKGNFIVEIIKSFYGSNEAVLKAGYETIQQIETPEQLEAYKHHTEVVAESLHQKYLLTALVISGAVVGSKWGSEWIKSRKILNRTEIAPVK